MDEEILINLQGDEPLMHPSVIDAVAAPCSPSRTS